MLPKWEVAKKFGRFKRGELNAGSSSKTSSAAKAFSFSIRNFSRCSSLIMPPLEVFIIFISFLHKPKNLSLIKKFVSLGL